MTEMQQVDGLLNRSAIWLDRFLGVHASEIPERDCVRLAQAAATLASAMMQKQHLEMLAVMGQRAEAAEVRAVEQLELQRKVAGPLDAMTSLLEEISWCTDGHWDAAKVNNWVTRAKELLS